MAGDLDKVRKGMMDDARRILEVFCDTVQAGAIQRAPIRFGELRGSSTVEIHEHGEDPGNLSATITFHAQHAEPQHEREDYEHPRGGEAKYLERELAAQAPRLQPLLAAAIRKRFEG